MPNSQYEEGAGEVKNTYESHRVLIYDLRFKRIPIVKMRNHNFS